MNDKKIVWIDMDGVLVDFNGHVEETISKNEFLKTAYKGRYDQLPQHLGVIRWRLWIKDFGLKNTLVDCSIRKWQSLTLKDY